MRRDDRRRCCSGAAKSFIVLDIVLFEAEPRINEIAHDLVARYIGCGKTVLAETSTKDKVNQLVDRLAVMVGD